MIWRDAGRDLRPGWLDEILGIIRSEPGLAWFFAQGLFLTQPVLEAFWPAERIESLAQTLQDGMGGRDERSGLPPVTDD